MRLMKHTCRTGLVKGLFAALLLAGTASCEDYLDAPATPGTPDGNGVQVELSFGFADEEDGYDLSGTTRAGGRAVEAQNGAFAATLAPKVQTRAGEITRPDALYELHVMQYTQAGELIGSVQYTAGATTIGSKLTYTLTQADDCQLVVFARGQGNTAPSIPAGNLSNFQKLTVASDLINDIPTSGATQEQMNKMPYILHLPHVNVTGNGKLQSLTGAHDARLLLKRLAVKLTVNWNVSGALTTGNYALKEVKLCQVPKDFRILPVTETNQWGTVYPNSVSEFIEYYRLTATDLSAGTKTVWIPANAQGISAAASSPYYRTRENAPEAASFVEMVVDNSQKNERLYYRAYLGGESSTDFNLFENTDYNWTIRVNSADYRADARIQLLDQTPVVSTNLVPTANCQMMLPGTNICFNPYKHTSGTGGWNTYLTNGATLSEDKTITSVRVLWQTKDAGTSGNFVLGYVVDDSHHENLVNGTNLGDKDRALVHVKVPVTKGGNAVLEAKNSSGVTVWSWHIWITDYIPIPLSGNITDDASRTQAITAARAATMNGRVQAYDGTAWTTSSGRFYKKVIMDRNMGAIRGTYSVGNVLEAARAYGFLYQWGRKDPTPGSVDGTSKEIGVLYDGEGKSKILRKGTGNNMVHTIQNPDEFTTDLVLANDSWGGGTVKTIYDPCPAGWRVPDFKDDATINIFAGMGMGTNTRALVKGEWKDAAFSTAEDSYDVKNGFLYKGEVWFPIFRLREKAGSLREPYKNGSFESGLIPSYTAWGASASDGAGWYIESKTEINATPSAKVSGKTYGFGVRCVQE